MLILKMNEIFICPECEREYNLPVKTARHFLCECGYEGSLYLKKEFLKRYIKTLKSQYLLEKDILLSFFENNMQKINQNLMKKQIDEVENIKKKINSFGEKTQNDN